MFSIEKIWFWKIGYRDVSKALHCHSVIEQTTRPHAISISRHTVGFSGHCEINVILNGEIDDTQHFLGNTIFGVI